MSAYRNDHAAALARIAALEKENADLRTGVRVLNSDSETCRHPEIARVKVMVHQGRYIALVSGPDDKRRRKNVQAGGCTWKQAIVEAMAAFDAWDNGWIDEKGKPR